MPVIVKIVSALDGSRTPHDGRYIVAWNPHTREGALSLTSTDDISKAKRFRTETSAFRQYCAISREQPTRRFDGAPNMPLRALHIAIIPLGAE